MLCSSLLTIENLTVTGTLTYANCVGATGAAGTLIKGDNWGQYLYYNGSTWLVGGSSIILGTNAGQYTQGNNAIAIGTEAGQHKQSLGAQAFGTQAGQINQGTNAVAIGDRSGKYLQGTSAIAIGVKAGQTLQKDQAIAIGYQSGQYKQSSGAIAIGYIAGRNTQGSYSVAIGQSAGQDTQGRYSVAIGQNVGQVAQGEQSVAIGQNAGRYIQGMKAVAIGTCAGQTNQNVNAIAIGCCAGAFTQGTNAIAIGFNAGLNQQPENSIIINASETELSPSSQGCYINPIKSADNDQTNKYNTLLYDSNTKQVLQSTLNCNGNKSFIIEHPIQPDRYLVHTCLEGPEVGVYYRGTDNIINGKSVIITLPKYCSKWNDFTIHATPIGKKPRSICTSRVFINQDNICQFEVFSKNGEFDWVVFASRESKKLNNFEPLKTDVIVQGNGPYKWIG